MIEEKNKLKVLLLYPNQRSMSLIPPSMALFSSLLKKEGIDVELFDTSYYKVDGSDSDEIEEENLTVHPVKYQYDIKDKQTNVFSDLSFKVDKFNPNLIVVTVTDSTILLALSLLKSIEEKDILNIVGGVFPTFAPERTINFPEIDMICVGDGEVPLIELCKRLINKESYDNVSGIWVKKENNIIIKNKIEKPIDINKLPHLDLSIFDERRLYRMMGGKVYKMLPIETHRGCPFMCTYCGSPTQNKTYMDQTGCIYFRKKTVENVKKELIYLKDKWKAEYFFFWADTFFSYSDEELEEFCRMYEEIKLPFYCQARPETIKENIMKRLKEVGMHRVGVGIEHGNEDYRRRVLKRYYTNQQAIDSLNILYKLKIPFSLNNIIGLPDETPELAMDTIDLNRRIKGFEDTSCSIFQPFYGTSLREYCIKKGYIKPDLICPHNAEGSLLDMPSFPKEKISGLQRTFNMYVRMPKERWDEIKIAEKFTPEGNAMWKKLRKELIEEYF